MSGEGKFGCALWDSMFHFRLDGAGPHTRKLRNPLARGCLTGGSSSGAAVSVATGLVDFALAGEAGGNVRTPAAYCGVYSFRPTYDKVPGLK